LLDSIRFHITTTIDLVLYCVRVSLACLVTYEKEKYDINHDILFANVHLTNCLQISSQTNYFYTTFDAIYFTKEAKKYMLKKLLKKK